MYELAEQVYVIISVAAAYSQYIGLNVLQCKLCSVCK